jgi:sugar/nucleoside kinase (ribokinase family)
MSDGRTTGAGDAAVAGVVARVVADSVTAFAYFDSSG